MVVVVLLLLLVLLLVLVVVLLLDLLLLLLLTFHRRPHQLGDYFYKAVFMDPIARSDEYALTGQVYIYIQGSVL